jgi:predicted transcriptional regulator
MIKLETQIKKITSSYLNNLEALIRSTAISLVPEQLQGKSPPPRPRERRDFRSPEELSLLTDNFLKEIKSNPGSSMKELAAAVGCDAKKLELSAHRLVTEGQIKKIGSRRKMKYFPVSELGKKN